MTDYPTIRIHAGAPIKPAVGQPCNGCGICCLAEPCPVSALLLSHQKDACPALVWEEQHHLYRCGMLIAPSNFWRWLPALFNRPFIYLVRRWLALDIGCDADIDIEAGNE